MAFERVESGNPWEESYGYCRALRAGNTVYVSGTAARGEQGEVPGGGDMYAQAVRCLEIISTALQKLGADFSAVVRTVVYVTDISRREEVARAHHEAFGNHPPASTLVEVTALAHPEMLIEIEVTAVAPD
jgi:isochorismate pyruvate lyase